METSAQGQFPMFRDGDVLVILDKSHFYKLHSYVLRRQVPVMAELLMENKGAMLSAQARKDGNSLRWRIDLHAIPDPDASWDIDVKFVQGHINSRGQTGPIADRHDDITSRLHASMFENYDNLFKVLYQEKLELGNDLQAALKTCLGIVSVANDLGALKSIGREIEHALLHYEESLWKSVAHHPVAWANFSHKIESVVIFKEAMIHLVGKWMMLPEMVRATLDDPVKMVAYTKLSEVHRQKERIEVRMLAHYTSVLTQTGNQPENMKRGATGNPSRSVYANDIYGWMALSLFRQWFSQMICMGQNMRARDGGYVFYTALSKGGQTYIDDREQNAFYQAFPMSEKAKGVMDNHLTILKENMKNFVAPLLRNYSHISEQEALNYLTSCRVTDQDCPWLGLKEIMLDDAAMTQVDLEYGQPDIGRELSEQGASLNKRLSRETSHGMSNLALSAGVRTPASRTGPYQNGGEDPIQGHNGVDRLSNGSITGANDIGSPSGSAVAFADAAMVDAMAIQGGPSFMAGRESSEGTANNHQVSDQGDSNAFSEVQLNLADDSNKLTRQTQKTSNKLAPSSNEKEQGMNNNVSEAPKIVATEDQRCDGVGQSLISSTNASRLHFNMAQLCRAAAEEQRMSKPAKPEFGQRSSPPMSIIPQKRAVSN